MKYTNIEVSTSGYVSSSGHYFVEVYFSVNSKGRYHTTFCLNNGFTAYKQRPQYMLAEVKRQIALLVIEDSIVWHEYDRDGNKRYDNLRYYDRELLLEMVKDW